MRARLDLDVAIEGLQHAEAAPFRIEFVWDAEGGLERIAQGRKIGQQQGPELDELALALRMRQALD